MMMDHVYTYTLDMFIVTLVNLYNVISRVNLYNVISCVNLYNVMSHVNHIMSYHVCNINIDAYVKDSLSQSHMNIYIFNIYIHR